MSFICTRGGSCVTASQAILRGPAPNGGLYVPAFFPVVGREELKKMIPMSYQERAAYILSLYLDDFEGAEVAQAVKMAYARFDSVDIAPVVPLSHNIHVLELFHGPTLAFKDMALQLLPHLMRLSAKKNGETREVAILTATSGDTGKAALEGFSDAEGTSCTVFYPEGGVSRVQQLQMVTTRGRNTHVVAVKGNFDDAQTGVKKLFANAEFNERVHASRRVLSSANSINLGRLAPQIVYYFSAYCDLLARNAVSMGDKINVSVPTGNFGDILAAWYAKRMGLPIGRLICASNRNNVLTDFIKTGIYNAARPFYKTMSPSMDILISSNLERYLFELCDRNDELLCAWMRDLKENGSFNIGAQYLEKMQRDFYGAYADDEQTCNAIRILWQGDHYVCDPHTAVALYAIEQYKIETHDLTTPTLLVSTASPYKFAPDVAAALFGEKERAQDAFVCARRLSEMTGVPVPEQILDLESMPVRHSDVCEQWNMDEAVLRWPSGE